MSKKVYEFLGGFINQSVFPQKNARKHPKIIAKVLINSVYFKDTDKKEL